MVQVNTYNYSTENSSHTIPISSRVRYMDVEIQAGFGRDQHGPYYDSTRGGGAGATVSGRYYYPVDSGFDIIAYVGESATDRFGGHSPLADAGDALQSDFDTQSGGGSLSALTQEKNSERFFIGIAGGGGGAGNEDSNSGPVSSGGGGGSPGGSGGGGSNPGKDAEVINGQFADLGGDGGKGETFRGQGGQNGDGVGPILQNTTISNNDVNPYVDITTYGLPAKINDLTTSLNNNYNPHLSWNSNHNGINQEIYRKERNDSSFSRIATVGSNSQSYTDTNVSPNSTYSYKIVQNNEYYQEGNISIIHTPNERVQVYRNGSWGPATLQTY